VGLLIYAVAAVTAGTIHRINALPVTADGVVAVKAVTMHEINKIAHIENLNQDDISLFERSGPLGTDGQLCRRPGKMAVASAVSEMIYLPDRPDIADILHSK
jgi:hypothetical protein